MGIEFFVLSAATPTPGTVDAVVDGLTSGLTDAGSQLMGAVTSVLPVALPVMIGLVVIGLGIKIFKKVTGAKPM